MYPPESSYAGTPADHIGTPAEHRARAERKTSFSFGGIGLSGFEDSEDSETFRKKCKLEDGVLSRYPQIPQPERKYSHRLAGKKDKFH